jgi:hypothetical protein
MFVVSIFVNIGMWFERFVIIVRFGISAGPSALGLFLTLFLLFVRVFPTISPSTRCRSLPIRRRRAHMPNAALIGVYSDPDQLMHAADGARKRGFKNLDAYTPYPLHGLEKALGLPNSWVPWATLIMGSAADAEAYLRVVRRGGG